MTETSYDHHRGPGRRFAAGTTRGDHLLGLFGFVAHAFLFCAMAAGFCWAFPAASGWYALACLLVSAVLFVVRAAQAGSSTTTESVEAVRKAWGRKP